MGQTKEKKLGRYPHLIGLISVLGIVVLAQVVIIVDCFYPVIQHYPDAVSSVMSTCSEVVAGLYGITLTGYIFFADRFQHTPKDDESLYDAVQALTMRYNHMAGIISLMCLVCILFGECIVLYGSNTLLPQPVYRFWVNETLLLFFCTFDFILYFVISVLDPHKVNRISAQKKNKLSNDKTAGDLQQFMADWNAIEECLREQFAKLINTIHLVPGARNKPEIIHTLESLRNYGRIGTGLWRKLEKLRQYHNLVLHSPGMTVTKEMCDLAREVLSELRAKKK